MEHIGGNLKKLNKPSTEGMSLATRLGKLPPMAIELEEAVLGALMLERDAFTIIADVLKPDSFYKDEHKLIFEGIRELFRKGQPIDILTVTNQLRTAGKLEFVGGAYYISELTNRIGSASNIEYHARIVAQKFILRELIRFASHVQEDAYEETTDVFELLDKAQGDLFSLYESKTSTVYQVGETIQQVGDHLDMIASSDKEYIGVPTGFKKLDHVIGGFQEGDFIIIAARPGMGKCLGKGTKVIMYNGAVKCVEDVAVGDLLMGDDSAPRKVLSIARGREKMYWIRQNKGIDYRVNESHILSLKRSRSEGGNVPGTILNISVHDWLTKTRKFQSNYKGYKVPVDFIHRPVPIHPYFLGLWLGDGHSYSSRITSNDEEIIGWLRDFSVTTGGKFRVYRQEGKCNNYGIVGTGIQSELSGLRLLKNKHIPLEYIANSRSIRLEILAGLIDSDGHYQPEYKSYEITVKNKMLAEDIKYLCDTLGYRTSLIDKQATIKSRNFSSTVYRVRFSGNVDEIPVKVMRKKATERIATWNQTGIKVEYDMIDDYYGFEIDGNKLFLLEDCTVTHNTAFILSVAKNAVAMGKKKVAIFSLEMSSLQLAMRLVAQEIGVPVTAIKKGDVSEEQTLKVHILAEKMKDNTEYPLYIDDSAKLNIFDLRAKARRLVAAFGVEMIIIDYLQLMQGLDDKNTKSNREQEISTISRSVKALAKELKIPVVALSQLSRQVEQRGGNKRPQLSDLRESGSLEQDADVVMFIHRPEYYGMEEKVDKKNGNTPMALPPGYTEIIIAKNRQGAMDDIELKFIPLLTAFEDVEVPTKPDLFTSDNKMSYEDYQTNTWDNEDAPF